MRDSARSFFRQVKSPTFWALLALILPLLHLTNALYQCSRLTEASRRALTELGQSGQTTVTVRVENVYGIGPINNWSKKFDVTAQVENKRRLVSLNAVTSEYSPIVPLDIAWPFALSGVLAAAAAILLSIARRPATSPRELLMSGLVLLLLLETGVGLVSYW